MSCYGSSSQIPIKYSRDVDRLEVNDLFRTPNKTTRLDVYRLIFFLLILSYARSYRTPLSRES